ncbi:MAG TPA: phage tail tip lysozyme [Jatrophihabitans sp.]|nr:phage tail tip lysozyme [Jatrophihabitans sp.]
MNALITAALAIIGLLVALGTPPATAATTTTQLQWDLAGLGYLSFSGIDGSYGPATTAAVKSFQTDQCLSVDGVAGTQTDGALSGVVKLVQDVAGATADGAFGSATKSAVAAWQSANNLTADGQAGPATMAAMQITRNHQCGGPGSGQPSPGSSAAAQLQWDLAGLGYLAWSGIDGIVGPVTEVATETFQTDACLSVDGIAGPQTDGALVTVIKQIQTKAGTTADGAYGPNTRTAVTSWQQSHSLPADGQAGPATMSAMGVTRTQHCGAPPTGTPGPGVSATTQLQWDLAGLGYLPWSGIDGITGPHTAGATEAFQADRCLSVDGIAGPQTNGALVTVIKAVQSKAGTTADGAYGPNTRTAVTSWQSAHGLTADGQAGPATMIAMGISRTVSGCTPPPGGVPISGSVGDAIVSIAQAEMNNSAHNHEVGGYNCNYYTTYLGESGTGSYCSNGWKSEEWCADFAMFVWQKAGISLAGLNAGAVSFYHYGRNHGTWHTGSPRIGDAVVFNVTADGGSASHVGLVVGVSGSTFTMISGNTYNPSDGQDDAIKQVTLNDTGGGISGFADPVTAQPANNNQAAFQYFTGKGLSKVQAAGIVGNFDQESSMNPAVKQYGGGPGRGIAQWSTGGRWDSYASDNAVWYAGTLGANVWTLNPQLTFTWYELATYSNYGLASLRAAGDVNSSVIAFQDKFEGCSVCETANRERYAQQALAYYG